MKNLIAISNDNDSKAARIIQYFTRVDDYDKIAERVDLGYSNKSGNYSIINFRDAKKQFVANLLKCRVDRLSDIEFLDTELGEEWWYNDFRTYLMPYRGEVINEVIKFTPRKLLQSENPFVPNVTGFWTNMTFVNYTGYPMKAHSGSMMEENAYLHTKCKGCGKEHYTGYKYQFLCKECIDEVGGVIYPNWIIDDLETTEQSEIVKNKGGITIGLNPYNSLCHIPPNAYDYTIEYEDTLDLVNKLKEILL